MDVIIQLNKSFHVFFAKLYHLDHGLHIQIIVIAWLCLGFELIIETEGQNHVHSNLHVWSPIKSIWCNFGEIWDSSKDWDLPDFGL